MKPRAFDPLRLDVEAFAREGGSLHGEWPLESMQRVATLVVGGPPDRSVAWHAAGEHRSPTGAEAQTWLRLAARATLGLACQRCLEPVDVTVAFDRRIRFVGDERAAERLDAEVDEDVLATSSSFDLRMLVEDELLLGLPLVPRHDRCPDPLPMTAGDDAAEAHPFAALAALKKPDPGR